MYHALLRQQIETTLSPELADHPQVRGLLDKVQQTYVSGGPAAATREEPANGHSPSEDNALFLSLLAGMHSGILIESADRKIRFTNPRLCSLFRLERQQETLVGTDTEQYCRTLSDRLQNPGQLWRTMERVRAAGQPVQEEVFEMKDGTIMEWNYLPAVVNGVCVGHFWEFKDITAHVRSRQRLAESEERNRLVMHASLDAIIIADETRTIRHWTPQAEKLFGWSPEEAIGERMTELLHPRGVSGVESSCAIDYPDEDLDSILNQVLELTAVHKDGREFQVELIVVPYRQHGKTYYCKFVKDISYRKQAEDRRKQEEEKYRNITANMKLGMVELGADGIIQGANQSFLDMCGYTAEELIGDNYHKLMPSQEEMALIRSKQRLRAGGTADQYEIPVRNKTGEDRWWLVSAAPNYNDQGVHTGSVGILLDITDQKRMESELAGALMEAEQASLAKEAFLANMSHEIRTPLNAIIGMIRELSREELSPQRQAYLGHTDTAARHLLSIVTSILDLSKIEAGELELEEEDFSLESMVSNIDSMMHMKAAAKGLELSWKLDPGVWPTHRGDEPRIRQVLINLLDNAIKFTPAGFVHLAVGLAGERDDRQSLCITISDSGIGMEEHYLDQLFTKFSQADRSTSRRFGGTGLGMAITREILTLMNGTISVTSRAGEGTQFTVELDLARGEVDHLSRPSPVAGGSLEGVRILLVEDNLMNRLIAKKSLSHFGCTVDEAENGRVALTRLGEHRYDLILMDIQMPELDGVETTKIIRHELGLDLPIVALTANAFKQDIDRYLACGMNDYVTKPFEEHQLFTTLLHQVFARC